MTLPPFISSNERHALAWLVAEIRRSGRAPIAREVLVYFRATESWLENLRLRGLVARSFDRIIPTRNGVRASGDPVAINELGASGYVVQALKGYWLATRSVRIGVAELASFCRMDADTTARVLMMSCPAFTFPDPATGLPGGCQLDDGFLHLDATLFSGLAWEFLPPRTSAELIARCLAGERSFASIRIEEAPLPREYNGPGEHHQGRDLSGLVVAGGHFMGASLMRCSLQGATFEGVTLRGSLFVECGLRGCTFRRVDAREVQMVVCHLEEIIVENSTFEAAVLDRSWFTSSTGPALGSMLYSSRWDRVTIDQRDLNRAEAAEFFRQKAAEPIESGPSQGEEHTSSVAEERPLDATPGSATTQGRLRFKGRDQSAMVEVIFDEQLVHELDGDLIGVRVLRLLHREPGREIHVLDLYSAVHGGDTLQATPLAVEDARALVRSLGLELSIARTDDTRRWLRTCALLRRLDLVRTGTEKRKTRKGDWDAKRESLALEFALKNPDYAPQGHGNRDDPVARVEANLAGAYRRVFVKLKRKDPRLGDYLEAAIKTGETWRFVEPPLTEEKDTPPENAS